MWPSKGLKYFKCLKFLKDFANYLYRGTGNGHGILDPFPPRDCVLSFMRVDRFRRAESSKKASCMESGSMKLLNKLLSSDKNSKGR